MLWLILFAAGWVSEGQAKVIPSADVVNGQLKSIRQQVAHLEKDLFTARTGSVKTQMVKMRKLFQLQLQEKKIGQKRIQELDTELGRLLEQKSGLEAEKTHLQKTIHIFLENLHQSELQIPESLQDRSEGPILKVLARLVHRSVGEVRDLHHNLLQTAVLEKTIEKQREQITFISQCLQQQESILTLNHQLQLDLLKKKQVGSIRQFESYQKLKTAEGLRNFFW